MRNILIAILLGTTFGLLVAFAVGENPWNVAQIMARSAFGSRYDFGMTLAYTTPLIFTGLSVALAFHAGLFNIGAEGQLLMSATAVGAFGMSVAPMPAWVGLPLGMIVAVSVGGAWAWIAGWLKVKRGSHEVITTIMLNLIAASISSYLVIHVFKNPDSQNPETAPISAGVGISTFEFFEGAPVHSGLFIAIALAFAIHMFLKNTPLGYEFRLVGQNEKAAMTYGVDAKAIKILALSLSGAIAGMVGWCEVAGVAQKMRLGFSADYGFMGIAVALLARNNPIGIFGTALLFGALQKGATDLDFETEKISKDLALVLQAVMILVVASSQYRKGKG